MNITIKIQNRIIPVGLAHPGIKPNFPGRSVSSHSAKVKFAAFISGSLTTSTPKQQQKPLLDAHCLEILVLLYMVLSFIFLNPEIILTEI